MPVMTLRSLAAPAARLFGLERRPRWSEKEPDIRRTSAALWIDATHASMARLGAFVRRFVLAGNAADAEALADRFELAVHELAVNVADHAYRGAGGSLTVVLEWDGTELRAHLVDEGRGFDPDVLGPVDLTQPHEHGYGLYLVNALADRVDYRRANNRNTWTVAIFASA